MRPDFRTGLFVGLAVAVVLVLVLHWHWQPERQVRLHSEHLLRRLEARDWKNISASVAGDYRDQWANDRDLLLRHLREVMSLLRNAQITAAAAELRVGETEGNWTAKISLHESGEFAGPIVTRVNSLRDPFELRWRKQSARPWDWKLSGVSNSALEVLGDLEL